MKTILIVFVLVFSVLPAFCDDGDALYERALQALRESDTDHSRLMPAIQLLVEAEAIFEKAGNNDKAAMANSAIYWSRKRMTISDIPRGETAKVLDATSKAIPKNKAKEMLAAADAAANALDQFSIAIRYFEVADRFPDTDEGRVAMKKSLDAMQKVVSQPRQLPPPKTKPPEVSVPAVTDAKARQAIEEKLSHTPTFSPPWDVTEQNLIFTETIGNNAGSNKTYMHDSPAIVIGFRYVVNGKILSGMQNVYMTNEGKKVQGDTIGKVKPNKGKDLIARDGYAVGGIIVGSGLQIVFMRIQGNRLNPADSYKFEILRPAAGEKTKMLGGTGEFVVGTNGWGGSDVDCFGLVLKKY